MKQLLIVGNWKCYKTFKESQSFLDEFFDLYSNKYSKYQSVLNQHTFAIAPALCNLAISRFQNPKCVLKFAAQNLTQIEEGAYTGDISPQMLQDLNVSFVILGHSEQRMYHHETYQEVNKKIKAVLKANLTPIICIGENLADYNVGLTDEIVKVSLQEALDGIDFSKVIISYEPIWAIGTGQTASPQWANTVCGYIKNFTEHKTKVLYGGSVKPDNIIELAKQDNIDGFLVGKASLNAESFIQLLLTNVEEK